MLDGMNMAFMKKAKSIAASYVINIMNVFVKSNTGYCLIEDASTYDYAWSAVDGLMEARCSCGAKRWLGASASPRAFLLMLATACEQHPDLITAEIPSSKRLQPYMARLGLTSRPPLRLQGSQPNDTTSHRALHNLVSIFCFVCRRN